MNGPEAVRIMRQELHYEGAIVGAVPGLVLVLAMILLNVVHHVQVSRAMPCPRT
jgi:hypothetical protein